MTMLQIRNVPDEVHRQLKSRAALAGTSLSEYALAELQRSLERPSRADIIQRLAARPRRRYRTSPTHLVRQDRDDRAGR
jgi:plasmid stability protein